MNYLEGGRRPLKMKLAENRKAIELIIFKYENITNFHYLKTKSQIYFKLYGQNRLKDTKHVQKVFFLSYI